MSMKGLLEVLVHLESFRNIDLFYQGLYSVQIKHYPKSDLFDETPQPKKSTVTQQQQLLRQDDTEYARPYVAHLSHS